jgi:5-methylcytosine-specific restriction endonuclease McrA
MDSSSSQLSVVLHKLIKDVGYIDFTSLLAGLNHASVIHSRTISAIGLTDLIKAADLENVFHVCRIRKKGTSLMHLATNETKLLPKKTICYHKDWKIVEQDKRSNVTNHIKKRVAAKQSWKCMNCGKLLDETFEVDHVMPLAHHGTNKESNLQALCPHCHRIKTLNDYKQDTRDTHENTLCHDHSHIQKKPIHDECMSEYDALDVIRHEEHAKWRHIPCQQWPKQVFDNYRQTTQRMNELLFCGEEHHSEESNWQAMVSPC